MREIRTEIREEITEGAGIIVAAQKHAPRERPTNVFSGVAYLGVDIQLPPVNTAPEKVRRDERCCGEEQDREIAALDDLVPVTNFGEQDEIRKGLPNGIRSQPDLSF